MGVEAPLHSRKKNSPWAGEVDGFNVHAGVRVRAGDREALERLVRYCARPPFSLQRLSLLEDGRVAYELRRPRRNGSTHLVLEPLAFIARIAALVPPPRYPLQRHSGVFAPRSSWRAAVVSRAAAASAAPVLHEALVTDRKSARRSKRKRKRMAGALLEQGVPLPGAEGVPPQAPRTSLATAVVRPVGARIDWASLLKRIFLEDVLDCPCGGRRRVLADVQEPTDVAQYLQRLGLDSSPPPIARARSPAFELS